MGRRAFERKPTHGEDPAAPVEGGAAGPLCVSIAGPGSHLAGEGVLGNVPGRWLPGFEHEAVAPKS